MPKWSSDPERVRTSGHAWQKAKEEAEALDEVRGPVGQAVLAGPLYDAERGEIVIPSPWYHPAITPEAAFHWRTRGFRFDKARQAWRRSVAPMEAQFLLPQVRKMYYQLWKLTPPA